MLSPMSKVIYEGVVMRFKQIGSVQDKRFTFTLFRADFREIKIGFLLF
jgi:hypothetical protein